MQNDSVRQLIRGAVNINRKNMRPMLLLLLYFCILSYITQFFFIIWVSPDILFASPDISTIPFSSYASIILVSEMLLFSFFIAPGCALILSTGSDENTFRLKTLLKGPIYCKQLLILILFNTITEIGAFKLGVHFPAYSLLFQCIEIGFVLFPSCFATPLIIDQKKGNTAALLLSYKTLFQPAGFNIFASYLIIALPLILIYYLSQLILTTPPLMQLFVLTLFFAYFAWMLFALLQLTVNNYLRLYRKK